MVYPYKEELRRGFASLLSTFCRMKFDQNSEEAHLLRLRDDDPVWHGLNPVIDLLEPVSDSDGADFCQGMALAAATFVADRELCRLMKEIPKRKEMSRSSDRHVRRPRVSPLWYRAANLVDATWHNHVRCEPTAATMLPPWPGAFADSESVSGAGRVGLERDLSSPSIFAPTPRRLIVSLSARFGDAVSEPAVAERQKVHRQNPEASVKAYLAWTKTVDLEHDYRMLKRAPLLFWPFIEFEPLRPRKRGPAHRQRIASGIEAAATRTANSEWQSDLLGRAMVNTEETKKFIDDMLSFLKDGLILHWVGCPKVLPCECLRKLDPRRMERLPGA